MNKPKKIPIRRCSGCNEGFAKKDLIRVVRNKDGEVSLDLTGKKSGRGAYLCPKLDCLKKAMKTRKISRSLECEIPDEVYLEMEEEIKAFEEENSGE